MRYKHYPTEEGGDEAEAEQPSSRVEPTSQAMDQYRFEATTLARLEALEEAYRDFKEWTQADRQAKQSPSKDEELGHRDGHLRHPSERCGPSCRPTCNQV